MDKQVSLVLCPAFSFFLFFFGLRPPPPRLESSEALSLSFPLSLSLPIFVSSDSFPSPHRSLGFGY